MATSLYWCITIYKNTCVNGKLKCPDKITLARSSVSILYYLSKVSSLVYFTLVYAHGRALDD